MRLLRYRAAKDVPGFLAPLMALLGVVQAALAVWPWPHFNIAFAFLAVVSLLVAVFLRLGDVLRAVSDEP